MWDHCHAHRDADGLLIGSRLSSFILWINGVHIVLIHMRKGSVLQALSLRSAWKVSGSTAHHWLSQPSWTIITTSAPGLWDMGGVGWGKHVPNPAEMVDVI